MSDSNAPAAPAAPASAASSAKPITPAQLSQEIQVKPPSALPPGANPPTLPDVPDQRPSPPRPDFKAALKARVMNQEEPKTTETPKPQAEAPAKKVVTFEAKVPDNKPEPAPQKKETVSADDAPPPAKATTHQEEQPVPEDQRRVMPHDKPDTARRIKAILAERDAERQAAAAAKKELDEAKKAGASSEELKKIREEHEALKADALRLRRLHDLKSDKEFNDKYDLPVKQVDTQIADTLKRYGFGEATLKAIDAEGGFAAFSRSSKLFTVREPDPENAGQTRAVQKTAAQLAREWVSGMDVADSEAVKAGLGKQQLLQSEKQAAIEKEQAEAKAYFENRDKATTEQQAAAKAAHEKNMADYKAWRDKAVAETEFLKDREIPAEATAEQKKAIEEYNEFNAQLRARIDRDPTNALEYGQLKLEAAEAHHLRRTLGEKDAEIASLREQLKQKSAALRTTPKAGSLLKGDGKPPAAPETNVSDPMASLKAGLRKRILSSQSEDE